MQKLWTLQMRFREMFFKLLVKHARKPMPDPSPDDVEPFSYFKHPNTQLAVPGDAAGTQVTPEGNLWTGFAEFFTTVGDPPAPAEWRRRTFRDGWIPVIEASRKIESVRYEIEMFIERVGHEDTGTIFHFVRITAHNESEESRKASAGMGMLYPGRDHRCMWKWFVEEKYSKRFSYDMDDTSAYRDGKLMYAIAGDGTFSRRFAKFAQPHSGPFGKVKKGEHCCIGLIDWTIEPGESRHVDFIIPYRPVFAADMPRKHIGEMSHEDQLNRATGRWEKLVGAGAPLTLPERKALDTSLASRVYNFQSRVKKGDNWVQMVNRLHYAHFWLRDSAFISRMWDVWGYHDIAEQTLLNFLNYAKPDGIFTSQKGQLDGIGQSLWAFGRHVRISGDLDFAGIVYPYVDKTVKWLEKAIAEDSYGLMPPTNVLDNELVKGRYTGHNIWALAGLREAIFIAESLGENSRVEQWQSLFSQYRENFLDKLKHAVEKNSGIVPPGMDVRGGQHWGNLLLLYVGELVEPDNEMVTTTFDHYREHHYAEGLATWSGFLHHYVTERVAQTALIRGEAERAVRDFYSMLLHTGPTHEGFEFTIVPWDGRDYAIPFGPFELANFPPHGWFATCYNLLLRNMIVMEGVGDESDTLRIFNGLSPAWVQPGCRAGLQGAPTHFGKVDISIIGSEKGAEIDLAPRWRNPPKRIIMTKPFFVEKWHIKGYDKDLGLELVLPAEGAEVEIEWELDYEKYSVCYRTALEEWKEEYRERYKAQ